MKLFAPSYYKDFTCIADRCQHSCCVGWEIDIDPDTLVRYETMTHPYGHDVRNSISYDGDPHFTLTADDRCPHLAENGLCKRILHAGESSLCEICREHPRFYHETSRGLEVGLGMSCEEACRIILSSPDYRVSEISRVPDVMLPEVIALLSRLYHLISDYSVPYDSRRIALLSLFGSEVALPSEDEWKRILSELEYLDEENKAIYTAISLPSVTPPHVQPLLERALAYFLLRYLPSADDISELRVALALSLMLERQLAALLV